MAILQGGLGVSDDWFIGAAEAGRRGKRQTMSWDEAQNRQSAGHFFLACL